MSTPLQLIARLRRYLPHKIWRVVRNWYWWQFWRRELAVEERELGFKAVQPIAGSERAVLTEAIGDALPFASLLEMGCGYGQNFHSIASSLSGIELVGVDSDSQVIDQGLSILQREGLAEVRLICADALELSIFSDQSFDLVVSCGFLLYLSPQQLRQAIAEMFRLVRQQILLLEQDYSLMREAGGSQLSKSYYRPDGSQYWLHDFRAIFSQQNPQCCVKLMPVANSRWDLEQWSQSGALITVEL